MRPRTPALGCVLRAAGACRAATAGARGEHWPQCGEWVRETAGRAARGSSYLPSEERRWAGRDGQT